MSDLFLVNFCHVVKDILKKEYSVTNSFFLNMKFKKSIEKKFTKNHHSYSQHG